MTYSASVLPLFALLFGSAAQSSTSVPDTTMHITMVVADVTCRITSGTGGLTLSQQVMMPLVSVDELQKGQGKTAEAPLKVDCSGSPSVPNGLTLSVQPAAGSSVTGAGANGHLKTDKTGVGLALTWKQSGAPVALDGTDTVFLPAVAVGNVWDLGIVARPVAIPGETPTGGQYTGAITLKLRYS